MFPLGFCYNHHFPIADIQTYIWIWCAICLGNLQVTSLQVSVFPSCEMGKQDYKNSKKSSRILNIFNFYFTVIIYLFIYFLTTPHSL